MSDSTDDKKDDKTPDNPTPPVNVPDPPAQEHHEPADQPHREAENEGNKELTEVKDAIAQLTTLVGDLAEKIAGGVDHVKDETPERPPWTHRGRR